MALTLDLELLDRSTNEGVVSLRLDLVVWNRGAAPIRLEGALGSRLAAWDGVEARPFGQGTEPARSLRLTSSIADFLPRKP